MATIYNNISCVMQENRKCRKCFTFFYAFYFSI